MGNVAVAVVVSIPGEVEGAGRSAGANVAVVAVLVESEGATVAVGLPFGRGAVGASELVAVVVAVADAHGIDGAIG